VYPLFCSEILIPDSKYDGIEQCRARASYLRCRQKGKTYVIDFAPTNRKSEFSTIFVKPVRTTYRNAFSLARVVISCVSEFFKKKIPFSSRHLTTEPNSSSCDANGLRRSHLEPQDRDFWVDDSRK
jgi:hypothetical protein